MDQRNKSELNRRIIDSVYQYRRKKIRLNIGFAAVILLAAGSAVWWSKNRDDGSNLQLIRHARAIEINMGEESEVKLVLGNNDEVRIEEDNVDFSYSSSGDSVLINNSQSVGQQVKKSRNPIYNTIVVPYGKRSQIALSDGSKVWLNAGTKLTYPAVFTQKRREVYLEGEAIFEVAHDKNIPFHVITENYDVEVLGTVFNVSSYPDDSFASTALESGRVKISFTSEGNENKEVIMQPGTLTSYDKSERHVRTEAVAIDRYMSWRQGKFIFDNSELKNIVKKIARHYNATIVIGNENLKVRRFSGSLNIDKSLENTLTILKETAGFEYSIENNEIFIN